jgi:hypothetical protein
MYVWVLSLWFISLLMACWSFSLLVRWVSDWNARRRRRLTPMYSKKAFRLAPVLMAVCAGIAIAAGYWAEHLASIYGDSLGFFRTSLGIGSLTLIGGGLMWIILSTVGDRARGRVRCPKCWYDMSDVPGLLCPECGRESKSRSQHTRTRRPRWAFMIAGLSIGLGVYGASVNQRVNLIGPLAAVPTWALMAGWEFLPEDWITKDSLISGSSLFDRLGNGSDQNPWIADRRVRAFGIKLSNGMLTDTSKRWNPRRLILIEQMEYLLTHRRVDGGENQWIGPPIDANELLRLSTQDVIAAYQAEYPSQEQLRIRSIEISSGRFRFDFDSPYGIAKNWIMDSLEDATPYAPDEAFAESDYYHRYDEYWDIILGQLNESTENTLTEFRKELLSPAIQNLLNAGSPTDSKNATSLMVDSGLSARQ